MIPVLVNNPLFRGITPERLFADLEEISFHTRSYKKGEILAQQGAVCNRLVILTKGSVRGDREGAYSRRKSDRGGTAVHPF